MPSPFPGRRTLLLFLLAALLTLAAGCAGTTIPADQTDVADLRAVPQSLAAFLSGDAQERFLAPGEQEAFAQALRREFYAPWTRQAPAFGLRHLEAALEAAELQPSYGENTLLRGPEFARRMRSLARPETWPSRHQAAIAVQNTAMRNLPTLKPVFRSFRAPGEGFPFDHAQETGIWAGTPLLVSHASADGAFVFAECRYAAGWIPAQDVASVSAAFIREYSRRPLMALTTDRLALADTRGIFRFLGRVGMLLPLSGKGEGFDTVLLPVRDSDGKARLRRARVVHADAEPLPVAATFANMARLADPLLGEPYGWGGLFGNRDCSALLQDLFTAFGVALPRNSRQQADFGNVIDLTGLADGEKESAILANGRPLASLVWKPGHIMLYVGSWQGRALVLHDAWGLRTRDSRGREGRHILGRVVLTTLSPGAELRSIMKPEGILLHGLGRMTTLDAAKVQ